jgi:hypothetical protein
LRQYPCIKRDYDIQNLLYENGARNLKESNPGLRDNNLSNKSTLGKDEIIYGRGKSEDLCKLKLKINENPMPKGDER